MLIEFSKKKIQSITLPISLQTLNPEEIRDQHFSRTKNKTVIAQNAKPACPGHKLVWAYLENHNLAIISLQVESPGGGDEALRGADNIVAPARHGLHHRGGFRAESHGPQLPKR